VIASGMALSAATAADIIVRGMEQNKQRVFVGKDSAFMVQLYRLNPVYAARAIATKMQLLIPA
jgi:hypothetical protein